MTQHIDAKARLTGDFISEICAVLLLKLLNSAARHDLEQHLLHGAWL
jgi:hypothetical protein